MPGLLNGDHASKKRKLEKPAKGLNSTTRRAAAAGTQDASSAQIERLESEIDESRRNYNNIAALISMIDVARPSETASLAATVSLCRVFIRLMTSRILAEPQGSDEQEKVITAWLKQRYQEYQNLLLALLQQPDVAIHNSVLTLTMRLAEHEAIHMTSRKSDPWKSGIFGKVLPILLEAKEREVATDFLNRYLLQFDDLRFYTFANITDYVSQDQSPEALDNAIALMSEINQVPSVVETYFVEACSKANDPVRSAKAHRKKAQEAWLALLRSQLSVTQRKNLLRIMARIIAPWFLKPELLMDFLTDSYNFGGATSLLALSGLFYLIQERNLDYPQFYHKLYSLLDHDLLHSKHRSRFFRLLNTFLSSTHLPAALVASFIKRLSRLAMSAPPAAIVAIVPWIYNLLKEHPSCTFMIHRQVNDKEFNAEIARDGMDDPFDMFQTDPMATDAIESSLWELESLQSHYHPNVASLAKIISEQFTKQAYNLEDFLDHSYKGMLDAELGKDLKKAPVVEFQIPKRIFTERGLEEDGGKDENLLRRLWQFSRG